MADKEIKEGDQVSWQWSGSRPGGKVDEVKEQGELTVTSHRGNEIKKNAEPDNPAVKVSRSGNDVVKRASELDVEKPGDKHKENKGEEKDVSEKDVKKDAKKDNKKGTKKDDKKGDKKEDDDDKKEEDESKDDNKENGHAKAGDKRSNDDEEADEGADEDADDDKETNGDKKDIAKKPAAKKQKTDINEADTNGEKRKPGRPKKSDSEPKPKKAPKKAATESGEPRRSSRNKA